MEQVVRFLVAAVLGVVVVPLMALVPASLGVPYSWALALTLPVYMWLMLRTPWTPLRCPFGPWR